MLFTTVLKDNNGFVRCYKKGRRAGCETLCVYFYPNRTPYNRFGITAGKKLGNAVTRNRVKRIIRAAYRSCEKDIPMGYDIVFAGRGGIEQKSSRDIEDFINTRLIREMKSAFEKGFWKDNGKTGK